MEPSRPALHPHHTPSLFLAILSVPLLLVLCYGWYIWRSNLAVDGALLFSLLAITIYLYEQNTQVHAEKKVCIQDYKNLEHKFAVLIEHSNDAIVLIDKEGTTTYASASIKPILGYSPEEFIGTSPLQFIHPDDIDTAKKNLLSLIHHPGKTIIGTNRIKHRDESWRWIEGVATNFLDDPTIDAVVINFRDVTDRHLAQAQLEESEEKYETIFNLVPEVIYSISAPDGKFVTLNPAFESITGWKRDEWIGKPFLELVHPDDQASAKEQFFKGLSGDPIQRFQLRIRTKAGTYRVGEFSSVPYKNENGIVGKLGTARDITKEKELDNAKDEFLAIAAHQLRTPLSSMRWDTELLLRDTRDDHVKTVLERVNGRAQKMAKLVNDLLSVSALTQGTVEEHLQIADVKTALEPLIEQIKSLSDQKHLTLHTPFSTQEALVRVDPQYFPTILENLLSNAINYTPDGGDIYIQITTTSSEVQICVQDTGIGISPEDQPHVFEKFYRGHNANTLSAQGSGLGLFVVRSFVKRWGGDVALESTLGKGSTFCIHLPIAKGSTV
ncbi:hypothetical protein C5B42_02805 [Candidatus Cerribacteria bacterium 'Amazon FNV 2010 28 9']|uniref:histidine kinase n=1 Tax=Candidatus Cerribacteria bacterium 'Amazon FNV 2010 28 9' TaxID=2081795 RepID=A0A317JNX3_9BACT|nr:MAG: hypothetical protein C5B42_02805 [Candidatus Cerribacteria bacterium 'Amazon FNV 2010 28 9']